MVFRLAGPGPTVAGVTPALISEARSGRDAWPLAPTRSMPSLDAPQCDRFVPLRMMGLPDVRDQHGRFESRLEFFVIFELNEQWISTDELLSLFSRHQKADLGAEFLSLFREFIDL